MAKTYHAEEAFDDWQIQHHLDGVVEGGCTDKDPEHCAFMCGIAYAQAYLFPKRRARRAIAARRKP